MYLFLVELKLNHVEVSEQSYRFRLGAVAVNTVFDMLKIKEKVTRVSFPSWFNRITTLPGKTDITCSAIYIHTYMSKL